MLWWAQKVGIGGLAAEKSSNNRKVLCSTAQSCIRYVDRGKEGEISVMNYSNWNSIGAIRTDYSNLILGTRFNIVFKNCGSAFPNHPRMSCKT